MHPYTMALLSAVPVPDPKRRGAKSDRILLKGDVPSPISPPTGCRFHTRCWKATDICKTQEPPLLALKTGHQVACHHPENAPDLAPGDKALESAREAIEIVDVSKKPESAEPAEAAEAAAVAAITVSKTGGEAADETSAEADSDQAVPSEGESADAAAEETSTEAPAEAEESAKE
jgi:peptide/nickel transport system ATP-binding protein